MIRKILTMLMNFVESRDVQGFPEISRTVYGTEGPDVPTDGYDATAEEER